MKALAHTEGNPTQFVVKLLKTLLSREVVKAWLVPISGAGNGIAYALVKDEALLDEARPFAPVMSINLARALSTIAKRGGAGKIGVILRPCEQRAFVELVKFHQIDPQSILVVGMDCAGTYELKDYIAFGGDVLEEMLLRQFKNGEVLPREGLRFRQACEICIHFTPVMDGGYSPDIAIGLFGVDPYEMVVVGGNEEILSQLKLEEGEELPSRREVIASVREKRLAKREEVLSEVRSKVQGIEGVKAYFATCIRCHNCMVNCPICYCPDCVFRTETFERTALQYLAWAERKGAVPMLPDLILFHLTRMNHMVTSCVGCGMCTTACPAGIDVGRLFTAVGERAQALFNYLPGHSLEEPPPVATFKENEFVELGH